MSYSCYISFKELAPEEVYPFLIKLKEAVSEKAADIVKDEYYFSPIFKSYLWVIPENKELDMLFETKEWVTKLFIYRWFYRDGLLGVYGIHELNYDLFDDTIYFQNSCDQDYDLSDWQKIPKFKAIADKWASYSIKEIEKIYIEKFPEDFEDLQGYFTDEHMNYWRRNFCYDEIWDMIEDTLEDESKIVYLSIYSSHDHVPYDCAQQLMKHHVEYVEKIPQRVKLIRRRSN